MRRGLATNSPLSISPAAADAKLRGKQSRRFGTVWAPDPASATAAPAGMVYGEPLLLKLAEQATMSDSTAPLSGLSTPATTLNALTAGAAQLRLELNSLRRSRSRLAKALLAAFWHRLTC